MESNRQNEPNKLPIFGAHHILEYLVNNVFLLQVSHILGLMTDCEASHSTTNSQQLKLDSALGFPCIEWGGDDIDFLNLVSFPFKVGKYGLTQLRMGK